MQLTLCELQYWQQAFVVWIGIYVEQRKANWSKAVQTTATATHIAAHAWMEYDMLFVCFWWMTRTEYGGMHDVCLHRLFLTYEGVHGFTHYDMLTVHLMFATSLPPHLQTVLHAFFTWSSAVSWQFVLGCKESSMGEA